MSQAEGQMTGDVNKNNRLAETIVAKCITFYKMYNYLKSSKFTIVVFEKVFYVCIEFLMKPYLGHF